MSPSTPEKVRENRARRMAERQGLRLVKSRRRDPRALGYGTYGLWRADTNSVEVGDPTIGGYGFSLGEIERALEAAR